MGKVCIMKSYSPPSSSLTAWIAGALLSFSLPIAAMAAAPADLVAAGKRIYESGVLASGGSLLGKRQDGTVLNGEAAACTHCHRPSGMGQVESDIQVAPITGRFLFPPEGEKPLALMDPRYGKRMNLKREPHTDDSLAEAIRNGRGSNGQALNQLMPRFTLSDADMRALNAYLRQLSVEPSPGIEDRTIRFATVITPGIEPARKKAMLDMLRIVVMQKNGSTVTGNSSRRHMVTAAELVLGTENKWALDVWELTGAPETWAEQLRGYYKLAPVFALISGLSNGTWEPVEQFCESEHVPCWFPSVAVPPKHEAQPPRYSFYFSRGLDLEADVMAKHLADNNTSGRVVQLVRSKDASMAAAQALSANLSQGKATNALKVQTIDVDQWAAQEAPEQLAQQLKSLSAKDTLMLWLRPDDLKLMAPVLEKVPAQRYASGNLLSATASFLPVTLRTSTKLVYPYEMPAVRERNVAYMHIWLKMRRIAAVDEALQSEVYFAMNLLTDTLAEMLDNLYRDYMIERAENMIGQRESRKAEDEMREQGLVRPRIRRKAMENGIPQPVPMDATGFAEHANGLREGTTVYPRLNLGPAQRYASKGAYIVGYEKDDITSSRLVALTPWIVP
jgi:cytochrome c553